MKIVKNFYILIFSLLSCNHVSKPSITNPLDTNTFNLYKETGNALGTTYSILYFSPRKIGKVTHSLDSLFLAINSSMSTYIPNSDISKINNGDSTVVVDSMFREVFKISEAVHNSTNGYFDPTVGQLVNAWGFGPKKLKLVMTPKIVDSLLQYVGFSKLQVTSSNTLKKQNPNIILDFNAVAKGYCIDKIADYFEAKKIDNYLIELGGELIAKGKHLKKQSSWTVGIDDPNQGSQRTLIATLNLDDMAMATSGNYRKFRVDSISGKKYVHTVNALTGYTQESNILSVSVLAENCAVADAYATAFMAMPLEKIKKTVANNKGLEVYIIYVNKSKYTDTFISKGFEQLLN